MDRELKEDILDCIWRCADFKDDNFAGENQEDGKYFVTYKGKLFCVVGNFPVAKDWDRHSNPYWYDMNWWEKPLCMYDHCDPAINEMCDAIGKCTYKGYHVHGFATENVFLREAGLWKKNILQ